jgi:hypothetical protein
MVSDYNAFAKVGGAKLWMTIDTSTSTSWVMSMACFMLGCQKVEIFAGGFLPALPPGPFPIDLLEAGIFQILSMVGMNGHTMTNAGSSIMGTPVMIGILDLGHINPNVFNHSGTIGLGECSATPVRVDLFARVRFGWEVAPVPVTALLKLPMLCAPVCVCERPQRIGRRTGRGS